MRRDERTMRHQELASGQVRVENSPVGPPLAEGQTDTAAPPSLATSTQTQRRNPDSLLFEDSHGYRSKMIVVPEWVRVVVLLALKDEKERKGEETRAVAVGNLHMVLSQIAYWSTPITESRIRQPRLVLET